MIDFHEMEGKWRERWDKEKIFEARPDTRKKFFVTFPYPYMNGYLHVGHFYTLMRVEALARFKRMQGYNVLFPQGWHCTGSPIINAAERVKQHEEKQWKIMRDMGFSDSEIERFSEPEEWAKFFPKEAERDYREMGMSVDFRRSFITTSLNPHYDRFIHWQFRKLKEKGLVVQGEHPVIWCVKCNSPVGDHSRISGEGETPQEFTMLKFPYEQGFIVAATLRPETIFGQTNLWVDPEMEYVRAEVNDEIWYMSEPAAKKLSYQHRKVKILGKIRGREMIGRTVLAPGIEREIPILPSFFCDPEKGTGIVTSVPSDAPDDWMGLYDLQHERDLCRKYNLDHNYICTIKPVPIILSKDLGDMPAVTVCRELGVKNQNDRELLEKVKRMVYKKGFYEGVMTANCGRYAGMPVEQAKLKVREELIKEGKAELMYEPTGEVVCRCLTKSIVKIVTDQWFVSYGNQEWKERTREALRRVKLYPEKVRQQFEYVIDWLNDWACTREYGLGTRLPWDERWVIESLSDSTIYMAYYTISHILQKVPADRVDDSLFDYVFLGEKKKLKIDRRIADEMKAEFSYYYPVDFRNSGKDLVQNHLAFFLFNHTAIFPEKDWPAGIGVNGFVTVDGEKMGKSLGNVILLREMSGKFGADASRFTILCGGEDMDDANWDSEMARSLSARMRALYEFCTRFYNKGGPDYRHIDAWMESHLNEIIRNTTEYMEKTLYRSALQAAYFELQNCIKWYLKRTERPDREVMNRVIETQVLLLAPVTPFVCEEIWHSIGKSGFVSAAEWPRCDEGKINPQLECGEMLIRSTLEDIHSVMNLIRIEKPEKISLFVAGSWKRRFFSIMKSGLSQHRDFKKLMASAVSDSGLKKHAQEISKMIPSLIKDPSKIPAVIMEPGQELSILGDAIPMIGKEFGCSVEVLDAESSSEPKAGMALPFKPAILIK